MKFSFGSHQFDLSPTGSLSPREPDAPFHLAVLGDFGGRANRNVCEPLGNRPVLKVDCDNFNQVLAKIAPKLSLALPDQSGQALELQFKDLEDFHPDQLLKQVKSLAALMAQRSRLRNPATSAAAVAELQSLLAAPIAPVMESAAASTAGPESDSDVLSRLLGGAQRPPEVAKVAPPAGTVDHLLREAVRGSVVPVTTARQTAMLSAVDLELTSRLRWILSHPQFQSLESAWRGLDLLVRTYGGEENLKCLIVDASKDELAADLQGQPNLEASGLWRLIQQQSEHQAWTVCLGLYTFGDTLPDIEFLARLSAISSQVHVSFLAGGSPVLVGCDGFDRQSNCSDWKSAEASPTHEAWQALRVLKGAVGLATPRFLLRLPYGKDGEPLEILDFEELPSASSHEAYLWGNSAILCGYLLAGAFRSDGWEIQTSGYGEVDDLPVFRFKEDGEVQSKPCAEAWLSDRAGEAISARGLIPVLSIRGRDAVCVMNLQFLSGEPFRLR